jgi:AcrR family transcriptional regulator
MRDFHSLTIRINQQIYLKDPESSDLGRKIISGSIHLIDQDGFESFTFRKLALHIGSTEASVYRYFENKHKVLLYITSWYWGWLHYRIWINTMNLTDAKDRLIRAVECLLEDVEQDSQFGHIDEVKLHCIIVSESSKAYLTKEVDQQNREGAFAAYKELVAELSEWLLELQPNYLFPHMLFSTVIEGSHLQRFFSEHLPRLTDTLKEKDAIREFYMQMVLNALKDN